MSERSSRQMPLVDYLGRKLKDDAVMELLEEHDMDVIYQFDRFHENQPDSYSAAAHLAGFELGFDAGQRLKTIWCYVQPKGRFLAVAPEVVGVPLFAAWAEARRQAVEEACAVSASAADVGDSTTWVRLERAGSWDHYEFRSGQLALVTLMLPWDTA
jgi:hypothetical protein